MCIRDRLETEDTEADGDTPPPPKEGKAKGAKQPAASSSSGKKIIVSSTPISAHTEKPDDNLKKSKSYWRSLDLSELIKELEKRGQVIEPPATDVKTIKGKAVREKCETDNKEIPIREIF